MTRNPLINAFSASAYIVVVVSIINNLFSGPDPDTFMAPVLMLSIFVLSIAFMSATFYLQPVLMFFDGERKEAVSFFIKTIFFFGLFVVIKLIILLLLVQSF